MKINGFKTLIFPLIVLTTIASAYSAEATLKIRGMVFDSQTGKPIPYVNVSLRQSSAGTISDSTGAFQFTADKEGTLHLIFSHVGYQKKELTVSDPASGKKIQVALTPRVLEFPNVVVSASLYEQPVQSLAQSAVVLERLQLIAQMQSNMTDMLATTPGFTQVWEYHSPLLLRGMNSKRLLVMKNGSRRIGTFPGGYFGQDMNIYGAQKVEIIKGPGSVIYGSGAISGIINLIGREPWGRPGTWLNVTSGFGSNNNEFLETANLCYQKENYGLMVHGKWRKADSFVYGDGTVADNSDVEDHDLSIGAGMEFNPCHKVVVHADYHEGDWGKPRGFNGSTKAFTEIRNEEERMHSDLAYTFSPGTWVDVIEFDTYYDSGTRDYYKKKYSTVSGKASSLDLVHYKDQYGGARLFANLKLGPANTLTTGLDGYRFTLDNPSEVIDYYYNTHGTVADYEDAGQQNWGVFLNDVWDLTGRLRLIGGLRYDAATVDEGTSKNAVERHEERSAFSGNLGMVYTWAVNQRFSLNVGRAFRMPTAEELFTEVVSCKGTKKGNPDLKPEYSLNMDAGFRGHTAENRLTYDLALFYNRLDDYICETSDTENESVDFTYSNTDAVIGGGELSASYRFDSVLSPANALYLGLGSSYVYGVDQSSKEDNAPLFGIPPLKITGELKYHGLLNRFRISAYTLKIQWEYADVQNRVPNIPEGSDGGPWGYEPSGSHLVWHAAGSLQANALPGSPKLRLIVRNLFNLEYQPYGSYIQAMGRNIKTVLSFGI